MPLSTIAQILTIIVVTIGLIIDWRTTKIPNWLTFPAAALGLVLNAMMSGVDGALQAVLGWLIGAGVMLFFIYLPVGPKYDKDRMGMGDAKLMAATGAFLGPQTIWIVLFYFALAYGAISIFQLMRAVPWKQVTQAFTAMLLGGELKAPTIDAEKLTEVRKKSIPIGLAIAIGAVLAIVWERPTLQFLGFTAEQSTEARPTTPAPGGESSPSTTPAPGG